MILVLEAINDKNLRAAGSISSPGTDSAYPTKVVGGLALLYSVITISGPPIEMLLTRGSVSVDVSLLRMGQIIILTLLVSFLVN